VALRLILTPLLLAAIDGVIDPGAVRVGFWSFEAGGDYYGVPMSNFAGWLLSGFIGTLAIELCLRSRKPLLPAPVQMIGTLWLTVFMWTAVAGFSGLIVPMLVGVVLLAGLTFYYVKYFYAFDEMLVMVDDAGKPIGTMPKAEVHHGNTELHSAFSVFVFNDDGEVLLQQRALTKKSWPGVWSNSCCGHVMLHETIEDAARRRLRYELGLNVRDLQIMLPDFRYRAEMNGIVENEICAVLVARCDREPRINPNEVAAIRWISWNEWVSEVAEPGNGYSYWSAKETEQLIQSPKFSAFRAAISLEN
jgi:isopentenyl-diphosphate delta-isomerase